MKFTGTSVLVASVVFLQVLKLIKADNQTIPVECENGGLFDGVKCVCFGNVEGSRCEIVKDWIFLGEFQEATIKVRFTITNFNYSDVDTDDTLKNTIKERLNDTMKKMFPSFFKDVQNIEFSKADQDSTMVMHDMLIIIPFHKNVTLLQQYEARYKDVEGGLKALKENCTDDTALCINGNSVVTTIVMPVSEQDLCVRSVNALFIKYFDDKVETDGLYCVSHCALNSPNRVDCGEGSCQIKKDGAQCFCPDTDKYLYTYSGCRGAVLMVAMYGGVGASIGVLLIVGILLGVFLYRKKYYE